jgi:hypothetical protein
MQLTCKKCGAPVEAENINLDRLLAKCSVCSSVFDFADQVGEPGKDRSLNTLDVPMPKGFAVNNYGGELTITRRWFGPKFILLTVFALFWNGFMVFWFGIAIAGELWPMALFGLIHAGVGLGLIYYVLTGYFNKTAVTVNMMDVVVKHGPLPYPGNKRLNRTNIKQLYCKEKIRRGKNSTYCSYEVHAVTQDDKHEKLLTGLEESEQALYVEQEIERALGLTDRPVRGEWGR